MNKIKRIFPSLLILGLSLGLAISFRSFFMSAIIEPIALMLWAGWRIIASVDQNIYWVLLIILASIVFFRLIPLQESEPDNPPSKPMALPPGHVERWQARMGRGKSRELRSELEKLLRAVPMEAGKPGPSAGDRGTYPPLQDPRLPGVQRILFQSRNGKRGELRDIRPHPLRQIVRWLRRLIGGSQGPDPVAIDEALDWMESILEINQDE